MRERELIRQLTPIGNIDSEGLIIPNHSGITSNIDAKNKLDYRYLLNSGDTATGDYAFDTNTFYIDSTNHYTGFGTSAPENRLHLVAPSGETGLKVDVDSTTTPRGIIVRSTDLTADSTCGFLFNFYSDDNVGRSAGRIHMMKEQLWTSTGSTRDSTMVFAISVNGTVTERMRLLSSGNLGIGTTTPGAKLHISSTDGIIIPIGTTAQRVATQGMIRYNTDTGKFEGYTGAAWVDFH